MHGSIWSVWFHTIPCMKPWPTDLPCNSTHGIEWFHSWKCMEPYDSMHGKVWNENQKLEILTISNFRSTCVSLSGNNWKTSGFDLIWFELENGKRYNKTGKSESFQTVRYKDLGFQFLQTMFAVWNRVRHFRMWFPFFLRPCSNGSFSNFRSYSRGSSCCFRSYFNVFDIFRCHYCGFLRFPYDSIRFHAYNFIIPYDSMHGTIWFYAIPCMEPYDSMRFHAWKRHEIIVWNHVVPCMESHGRLMNLDPGTAVSRISFAPEYLLVLFLKEMNKIFSLPLQLKCLFFVSMVPMKKMLI